MVEMLVRARPKTREFIRMGEIDGLNNNQDGEEQSFSVYDGALRNDPWKLRFR
jgi:hypothetical protein